jgi:hypothetical protein
MSASLNVRRSVIVIAVVAALVAIPSAATGTTTRASLTGMGGYCHDGGTAGALGKVQIVTRPRDAGFHPVHVDIRVAPGKLAPGAYQVWLVNLYRDDAGQVIGCSASPFANALTVKHGPAVFHGSVDRYTGAYELQVFVGSILGPGYGTAPT